MKNKKVFMIITIFMLVTILFSNTSIIQATSFEDAINAAQQFTDNGRSPVIIYQGAYIALSYLFNIVMVIAIVVSIFVGMILGIRIIFGSIDEQADAKKLLVPYIVIISVGALGLTLWRTGLNILQSFI